MVPWAMHVVNCSALAARIFVCSRLYVWILTLWGENRWCAPRRNQDTMIARGKKCIALHRSNSMSWVCQGSVEGPSTPQVAHRTCWPCGLKAELVATPFWSLDLCDFNFAERQER
jgi:hypothetical protein